MTTKTCQYRLVALHDDIPYLGALSKKVHRFDLQFLGLAFAETVDEPAPQPHTRAIAEAARAVSSLSTHFDVHIRTSWPAPGRRTQPAGPARTSRR
jgi:hypothetical protein